MTELPYRLEPAAGYDEYKVTSLLRDYLSSLMQDQENHERINQILTHINEYKTQLVQLRARDRTATIKEVYKAIDNFFSKTDEESKAKITCRAGCTHCCFIDVDISNDEAAAIVNYCNENKINIDRDYLEKQVALGRQTFSGVSKCIFLKDDLCTVYPVRPVACRKHWVRSDPSLCDFSKNEINQVGNHFDINTEILASALLNVKETGSLGKMLLDELEKDAVE